MRMVLLIVALLFASPAWAQTVVDQTIKQGYEVIFHVKDGNNSPYQGRLLYTPSLPAQAQITADELAQYQTWLAGQTLSPAQLTANEIAANVDQVSAVGSDAQVSLTYSTANQNAAALRTAYKTATRIQAIMIADFLNTLTNTQLSNLFSITTQQAQTLRTNTLAPAATVATAIRAAVGS